MAENEQLRRQEAARQAQQAEAAGTGALCKYCGAALDPELLFCSNCGEKTGGEERECGYCSTRTTKEFCPRCGRRVAALICPKCGTPSINDACENCGAILNPALEAVFTQEAPAPANMSAEELAKIEAEFKALEQNESPEFKAFQKKTHRTADPA
jgi:predicted amidophosphoribosyltransferase